MKKTFKMVDLDCANCGAKMEDGIRKIKGVQDVNISFMAQKITIDADENDFPRILKEACKVCKKIDADCTIDY